MENMQVLKEIQRIYENYLTETAYLAATRKPADGRLDLGNGPGSDPCHERFAELLEQALESLASASPSSEQVEAVLRFIYDMPHVHKDNKLVYWMLVAVHTLTKNLIQLLSSDDAAVLNVWYNETYPSAVRLPNQRKIEARLRSSSKKTVNIPL